MDLKTYALIARTVASNGKLYSVVLIDDVLMMGCVLGMWQCRLPENRLDKDRHAYISLHFSGQASTNTLVLGSNMHMALHTYRGRILGGSGYYGK
jgi:hypothetical protein